MRGTNTYQVLKWNAVEEKEKKLLDFLNKGVIKFSIEDMYMIMALIS